MRCQSSKSERCAVPQPREGGVSMRISTGRFGFGGGSAQVLSQMRLDSYTLKYRCAQANGAAKGPVRSITVEGCDSFATQDIAITARRDGECVSIEVEPLVPVVVEQCILTIAHEFARGEQVMLNGYQSWTTTAWLPAWVGMRGLRGVPQPIVDRYAIDMIGDYRFADYNQGLNYQHGYTYGVVKLDGRCALVGSLDESHGFTLVCTNSSEGQITLETECPQQVLMPGQAQRLAAYALVEGSKDQVYDRWFELSGVKARPVRPLVGYSSWYRHYGDIDRAKLEADLAGARTAFNDIDTGNALRVFQIDDGFCKVGDWLRVDAAKFPEGLAPLARQVKEAGFLPGLWLAPFVCEAQSWVFAQHSDWLLRDETGEAVRTGPHWSGAYALDTRNPAVRDYVRDVVRTVVRDWGFGLLKLDFLYAACLVPHDGMNRGELMADAMQLLREAAGEDTLLLGCGVPLGSAFGVVDYCRIGCDVGLDWDDKPHMRLLHRERVSTKNSLTNTVTRAPLDGRAFGNDPDVFFLRTDVKLAARRRTSLLHADAKSGSVLLTSDDMGEWSASDRAQFQSAVRTLLARKQ